MWNRRRALLGVVAVLSLALLLTVNIVYRLAFSDFRASLDSQLGEQLTAAAEGLAGGIDPDEAGRLIGEDFDPEAYLQIHELMRTFAEGNRLTSVALLDTLWNDPFADEPDSLNRLVYSLLDRDGQWALMSGLTWTSPTFQWGESFYRSAAAPVVSDESGRTIAIVRVEADAGYFGALSRLETVAIWIHVSSAILAVLLVSLFAWYSARSRRWDQRLLHSEKLIGLGRLAATIAHEIKNPLGIIKGAAQRLQRIDDTEKRAELLRYIPEEVDRLDRILTSYLRVASPDESVRVAIAIDEELPGWMDMAFGNDEEARRRWRVSVNASGKILADSDSPKQVLINLVNNALDVTPPGQVVDVEWRQTGSERGRLIVSDRGPGIPRKLRERVFEPFYTTKAKGSGLGLHAVRMMVERDGGHVTIEDNPGGGARVVVEWPLEGATHGLVETGKGEHGTNTDC